MVTHAGVTIEMSASAKRGAASAAPENARRMGCASVLGLVLIPVLVLISLAELEHVHQIADRRRIAGHVRIVLARHRIGQIVAAPLGNGTDLPVGLDELVE